MLNKEEFTKPNLKTEKGQIKFLGKTIAWIIPKDTSNFDSNKLSQVETYKLSTNKK